MADREYLRNAPAMQAIRIPRACVPGLRMAFCRMTSRVLHLRPPLPVRAILLLLLPILVLPASASAQQERADRSAPVAYTAVRDTVSGAKLPRLADPRTPQMRNVNRQLDSISAGLRCDAQTDRFGHKTEHWSDSRTTYAADDVLSVYIRFGGFCGGAHPINGVNLSATFDLRAGKPIPFRALFANYDRDAATIVRALFPEMTTAADRLPPERASTYDVEDEEYCLELYATDVLSNSWFSYTLTYAGLVAEPDFAHVIRACQEPALVPYARLRPFAAPGSILERVAAARASATTP